MIFNTPIAIIAATEREVLIFARSSMSCVIAPQSVPYGIFTQVYPKTRRQYVITIYTIFCSLIPVWSCPECHYKEHRRNRCRHQKPWTVSSPSCLCLVGQSPDNRIINGIPESGKQHQCRHCCHTDSKYIGIKIIKKLLTNIQLKLHPTSPKPYAILLISGTFPLLFSLPIRSSYFIRVSGKTRFSPHSVL